MTPLHSSSEDRSLRQRLADLIKAERDRLGSYDRLARGITDASSTTGKRKVDRRKLKRIAEGDNISITLDELEALNAYFIREGRGLAAVFGRPSIIQALGEKGHTTFLLGSRPHERRRTIELSSWDVRTMATLMRSSYRATPSVRIDSEEVFFRGAVDDLSTAMDRRLFHDEPWFDHLSDAERPSLVCVGSPRASHASELALAEMLSVKPFERPDFSDSRRLPFFFVWSQEECDRLPSAFAISVEHAPADLQPKKSEAPETVTSEGPETVAIYTNQKFYSGLRGETWNTYGVVVAQRRRTGQIWLVVTGLNGPGTLATARVVDSIATAIPHGESGRHGPVVWAVVQGDIQSSTTRRGDYRALMDERQLSAPKVWLNDG